MQSIDDVRKNVESSLASLSVRSKKSLVESIAGSSSHDLVLAAEDK